MRSTVVAFAVLALPIVTFAQEDAPEANSFRRLVAVIPQDPSMTGEWARLLPTIARQCGMTVDHESVRVIRNRSPTLPTIERYKHRFDGRLKAAWDAMATRDLDMACRTADGLWGKNGGSFPGVLRDETEGLRPTSPSFALGEAVP